MRFVSLNYTKIMKNPWFNPSRIERNEHLHFDPSSTSSSFTPSGHKALAICKASTMALAMSFQVVLYEWRATTRRDDCSEKPQRSSQRSWVSTSDSLAHLPYSIRVHLAVPQFISVHQHTNIQQHIPSKTTFWNQPCFSSTVLLEGVVENTAAQGQQKDLLPLGPALKLDPFGSKLKWIYGWNGETWWNWLCYRFQHPQKSELTIVRWSPQFTVSSWMAYTCPIKRASRTPRSTRAAHAIRRHGDVPAFLGTSFVLLARIEYNTTYTDIV